MLSLEQCTQTMSFLNIQDPKKRDAIVTDYLALVKRLQQRDLNEKAQDLARDEDLKEMFYPVDGSYNERTCSVARRS